MTRAALAVAMLAACGGAREAPVAVDPCAREPELGWDDARRAAIASAFHGALRGDDTAARVVAVMDRGAAAWRAARRGVCAAAGSAAASQDRGLACLRDWRRQFAALADAFAIKPGADVVSRARASIAELASPARCADADAMVSWPAPPADPAVRARTDALADRLAAARAPMAAGRPADALAIVEQVAGDPDAAGDAALVIEVELWRADLLTTSGRLDDARAAARHAYDLAVAARDPRDELLAVADIAALAAYDPSRVADAQGWLRTGQTLLAQLDGDRELEARLAQVEGMVDVVAGEPAAAAPALALAATDLARLDPDHPSLGAVLAMLGSAEIEIGKVAEAERDLRDALAHQRRDLGDDHPDVASALINLALVQAARGYYADAQRSLDDALALQARVLGADHASRAYGYLARAEVDKGRGDRAAAATDAATAERIARAAFGANGQLVAQAVLAAAELDADLGNGGEAVAKAKAARAIYAGGNGDDMSRALADAALARALAADHQDRAAIELARAAAGRVAGASRSTASTRALVATTYGELALAAGDAASAVPALREAESAFTEGSPNPWRLARTRFALARALVATDRAAAVDEATLAAAEAPRDGDPVAKAAIARWIAAHGKSL